MEKLCLVGLCRACADQINGHGLMSHSIVTTSLGAVVAAWSCVRYPLLTTAGDGPAVSVASSVARILERFAFLRDKFPLVSAGRKRQLQYAECFQIARFAIGMSHSKRTKILAAGPDNELSNPPAGIGDVVRILWSKSFVIVVMAVDDHVRVGCVQRIPQRFHSQVVAMRAAGTEKRLVKIS